jgi:hypothetical protein
MGAFPFSGCFISIFLSGVQRITGINELKPCNLGVFNYNPKKVNLSFIAFFEPSTTKILMLSLIRLLTQFAVLNFTVKMEMRPL